MVSYKSLYQKLNIVSYVAVRIYLVQQYAAIPIASDSFGPEIMRLGMVKDEGAD